MNEPPKEGMSVSRASPASYELPTGQKAPGVDYVVRRKLGTGGMGTVYEVVKDPGIRGAMKVMHPQLAEQREFAERFMQEVALCARLEDHPNLVKVKDCGKLADGTPFVVMELLQGRTLRSAMQIHFERKGPMPPPMVYAIAQQFCEGLAWLHSQNPAIVHRDFKPDNIFVQKRMGNEPLIKLLDFGVARVLDGRSEQGVFGTPKYMAPEQVRGESVTPATDIYAAALVIYEMLTERSPWCAEIQEDIVAAHMWLPPEPPSHFAPWLPRAIDDALLGALSKDPSKRPHSANALCSQLVLLQFCSIEQRPQDAGLSNSTAPMLMTIVDDDDEIAGARKPEHDTFQGMTPVPIEGRSLELADGRDGSTQQLVDPHASTAPSAPALARPPSMPPTVSLPIHVAAALQAAPAPVDPTLRSASSPAQQTEELFFASAPASTPHAFEQEPPSIPMARKMWLRGMVTDWRVLFAFAVTVGLGMAVVVAPQIPLPAAASSPGPTPAQPMAAPSSVASPLPTPSAAPALASAAGIASPPPFASAAPSSESVPTEATAAAAARSPAKRPVSAIPLEPTWHVIEDEPTSPSHGAKPKPSATPDDGRDLLSRPSNEPIPDPFASSPGHP